MDSLFSALLTFGIVVLAFYFILRPIPGMDSVFRGAGRAIVAVGGGVVRFTLQGIALMLFTASDAAITSGLSAYHVATARPHLVPENWAAFAQRFNDRLHRTVLGNL